MFIYYRNSTHERKPGATKTDPVLALNYCILDLIETVVEPFVVGFLKPLVEVDLNIVPEYLISNKH